MTKDAIKALRIRAGLNKARWADALGVRWITINRWERGETKPHGSAVKLMESLAHGEVREQGYGAQAFGAAQPQGGK